MKKFMIATGCMAVIGLSAVGFSQFNASAGEDVQPKEDGGAPAQAEEPTVQAENSESSGDDWFESLPFKEFEVEAEYGDGEYEADYDYEGGEPEAEIEDSRNGDTEIYGDEALNELSSILPDLGIDENTSKDDVKQATLEAFDLDSDYKELDIDIEFMDGHELEIEDE